MCPPGYHHNGFVATNALGHRMYITVHHVPKYMSCHKAIVVITGRAHCFHDNIYSMLILLLWDLNNLYAGDYLWPLIKRQMSKICFKNIQYINIYIYIYIYIYICIYTCVYYHACSTFFWDMSTLCVSCFFNPLKCFKGWG